MRRLPHILLLLTFIALGSGGLEYFHNLQHAHERQAARGDETGGPVRDESNCDVHAQLHLPLLATAWTPLLVCLGLFVAFLSLLTPPLISHRPLLRLDCRGPPAC